MIQKQSGMTLIEVLLGVTILSVIGVVIWNALIGGMSYSNKAVSQNAIQQEANTVALALTKIHQNSRSYELKNKDCGISVENVKKYDGSLPPRTVFDNTKLCISSSKTGTFQPSGTDYSLEMTITVYDKEHPQLKLAVETTLYRLEEE